MQAIIDATEGSVVVKKNYIPSWWSNQDELFKKIGPEITEDRARKLIPRTWAFEVSTVVDAVPILLYSKLGSKQWPHHEMLAQRIKNLFDEWSAGVPAMEL